jgi:hypothetical protein
VNIGMSTVAHLSPQGLKLQGSCRSGSGSDEKAPSKKGWLAVVDEDEESVHLHGRKHYDADGEHWAGGIIYLWIALTPLVLMKMIF